MVIISQQREDYRSFRAYGFFEGYKIERRVNKRFAERYALISSNPQKDGRESFSAVFLRAFLNTAASF